MEFDIKHKSTCRSAANKYAPILLTFGLWILPLQSNKIQPCSLQYEPENQRYRNFQPILNFLAQNAKQYQHFRKLCASKFRLHMAYIGNVAGWVVVWSLSPFCIRPSRVFFTHYIWKEIFELKCKQHTQKSPERNYNYCRSIWNGNVFLITARGVWFTL